MKKYIHSQEDIEDVVQDIFIHLWKHRKQIKDHSNIEGIIFKTAQQEISNFYRKHKYTAAGLQENHLNPVYQDDTNEEDLQKYHQKIENLLSLVSEKSKLFFLKHKIEGLSYSQIAEEHQISKNAVSKHVNKVIDFLKSNFSLLFLIFFQ